MDPKIEFIVGNFDLRGLGKKCNFHGCSKYPSKEALIFEIDIRGERKDMVSLYFCERHYNLVIKDIIKKLNELSERGKRIEIEVKETGYVTY